MTTTWQETVELLLEFFPAQNEGHDHHVLGLDRILAEFSTEEIENAMARVKTRRAPGIGGFNPEIVRKILPQDMEESNECWEWGLGPRAACRANNLQGRYFALHNIRGGSLVRLHEAYICKKQNLCGATNSAERKLTRMPHCNDQCDVCNHGCPTLGERSREVRRQVQNKETSAAAWRIRRDR
ncbi:hypothetical protein CBL_12328 [Carabus blaptoides fortunei]